LLDDRDDRPLIDEADHETDKRPYHSLSQTSIVRFRPHFGARPVNCKTAATTTTMPNMKNTT
jgi:hypothetical protein